MADPTREPTSTKAGILRPDELARHVHLERAECSPDLSPLGGELLVAALGPAAGTSYTSSTLPHPACNLSVERGHQRDEVGADPVVVTGVVTKRFDVTIRDAGWVYAAKFRPGGLAALTGVNARELRDATVPASQVLDSATTDALRELGPDASPTRARATSTPYSVAWPRPDRRLPAPPGRHRRHARRPLPPQGRAGRGEVQRHTRSLQRLFERYVGVSPKWVLSRYRMHDVVTDLDAGYGGSLADLAAKYGWFDQAHFTREFTDLVGVPPGAYQRQDPLLAHTSRNSPQRRHLRVPKVSSFHEGPRTRR